MTATLVLKDMPNRVPIIGLGILPLYITSKDTAPFGLSIVPKKDWYHRLEYKFLNFYVHKVFFKKQQAHVNRILKDLHATPLKEFYLDAIQNNCDLFLQGTVPEFEYKRRDLPAFIKYVGPFIQSHDDNEWEKPNWWDKLSNGKTNVLVTQGTLANTDFSLLVLPVVKALKNNINLVITTAGKELPGGNKKFAKRIKLLLNAIFLTQNYYQRSTL